MPFPGLYDRSLIALSVLVAIAAAYTAVALITRITAAEGRIRRAWMLGGSIAVGAGIWSMHFVGLLAFDLPAPMSFEVELLLLSALIGVAASALVLFVASRETLRWSALLAGALVMGPALAAMHYLGMAAMRVPGRIEHDPTWAGLSMLLPSGALLLALWWIHRFRLDETKRGRAYRLLAAAVMGLALVAMHYTGMAAVRFTLVDDTMRMPEEEVLRTPGLALGIGMGTLVVLAVVLLSALTDRRRQARSAAFEAIRLSEERFRALVEATADIVWATTPEGRVTGELARWAAYTGQSYEEYQGLGWLDAIHPEDREPTAAAWRAALQEHRPLEVELRARRADGEYRTFLVRAIPVRNPDGTVREWVGLHEDVTERRRLEAEREFLASASEALTSSLDYEATLTRVAHLAVPRVADWCAVDVVTETGEVRRVAVAHQDPAKAELAYRLQERYPADPQAPRGVHHVLRTREPEWMAEIPEDLFTTAARDEEHLRILRGLALRSYITVPLVAREQVLGAITFVSSESGRRFGPHDVDVAKELARRAAVAIDNARLYQESEAARERLEEQAAELEMQAEELQHQAATLEESQMELEMTNDELQRANAELAVKREEAEAANRAKSAFLATMSHEIRTPINAIVGYTELLEMGIAGPVTEEQKAQLGRIRMSSQHLRGLVDDILDLARVESGQAEFVREEADAREAVQEAISLIQPEADAQGIAIESRCAEAGELVYVGDEDRVRQILLNLLSNAVKFSEREDRVTVRCEAVCVPDSDTPLPAGRAWTCIRVEDTGIGIAPEQVESIFEPFVQVESGHTRTRGGTGLGLTISRQFARMMGGELTVRSELGKGSCFTLWLPSRPATESAGGPASHADQQGTGRSPRRSHA